MKRAGGRVGTGTRFAYDGEVIEIVEVHAVDGRTEAITKDLRTQTVRRFELSELMLSERSRLLGEDLAPDVDADSGDSTAVRWSAAPESARQEARWRAEHVREVLTGYRSGCAEVARPGEPRACYRLTRSKQARVCAKAQQLHKSQRTVERWVRDFERGGEVGLVSARAIRPGLGGKTFELFRQAALDVMREHVDMSKPNAKFVISHARARLIADYGVGAVPLPSPATAYRIVGKLERMYPVLHGSTKRNRDIASRSQQPYGKLHPARPGEYLLMDTTRLDVFAMDPNTLHWTSVDLTVAMDWYSRCITGLRLTPASTKAIDAAAVLYQCFRPAPSGVDWPEDAVWPPHGVPRSVLVEHNTLDPASVFAASPSLVPDTIVVDHGKIYVGEHLTSACRQLGISIQPARLRKGQDKGPVERFFRTIREGVLQELPGYKGPDVYSRGLDPEKDAFFFIDELEALLRKWVATVYHRRPHRGIGEPGVWGLGLSPTQMFEHGIARAGYIEAPRDPHLAYQFLKVDWRTIQPYGIQTRNRVYRGKCLGSYAAGEESPYREQGGKWPFHIDPDDVRYVYFFDLKATQQWHTLVWTEAEVCDGPMSEDGLEYARDLARKKHRYFDDKLALAELLERHHLSQARTPAERRIALRLSREQSTLSQDARNAGVVNQSEMISTSFEAHGDSKDESGVDNNAGMIDELDDDQSPDDEHFYDDVWEDI
ncbi:transposase [Mycolicibacterium porcinum]|uniref:DDE-type integrase/transposase/recombinase n=1 Tax=Mycolicibacterium porcinum TaxID=39693 RepID=UPI00080B700A|nr:DDE-type integrase/transposase/recombinase [Mycolicibacterium porcinum]OCB14534.1 transposase [Mycolicibacterium porcinum]